MQRRNFFLASFIRAGNNNEAQAFLTKGAQAIVRMRGLPYDCTAKQVVSEQCVKNLSTFILPVSHTSRSRILYVVRSHCTSTPVPKKQGEVEY